MMHDRSVRGRSDAGRVRRLCSYAVLLAVTLAGCNDMKAAWDKMFSSRDKSSDNSGPPPATQPSQSVDDTVQSLASVEGLRTIVVRGFGLVVGLVGTGGTDCPDDVRKYMQKEIGRRRLNISSKDLLDSRDSCVVMVTGEIPAAAQTGTRFDLVVRALGTQTTSLDGGTLLECDLKLLAGTSRGILEGRTIAIAGGPVFMSPFVRGEGDDEASRRTGRILGGGILKENRRLRLALDSPSYSSAVRIRDRLNSRFGSSLEGVADAVSPDTIQLKVPPEFQGRTTRFIELAMHTPLNGNAAFLRRKAERLAEEISHPSAAYEDIALTWEAIGRTVTPIIRPIYAHSIVAASFYATRTGLRLGDEDAVAQMAKIAQSPGHPFRALAVEELAASGSRRAAEPLRAVLQDRDNRLRIKACRGLVRHRANGVTSERVGRDNFMLDVVDAPGAPMVHVNTTEIPRIVVFGPSTRLRPPLSYKGDLLTAAADSGDESVRLVRVNPRHGGVSPVLRASTKAADFVRFLGERPTEDLGGRVSGLGLTYSQVVAVLNQLSKDGSLGATLVIERPSVTEDILKIKTKERPESEL